MQKGATLKTTTTTTATTKNTPDVFFFFFVVVRETFWKKEGKLERDEISSLFLYIRLKKKT